MLVPKELVAWWVKHHSLRLHVLFNRKNNNNNHAAETQYYYIYRDPDPLAEFISPFDFYDDQNVAAARNKYKKYLRIPAKPCDKSLE